MLDDNKNNNRLASTGAEIRVHHYCFTKYVFIAMGNKYIQSYYANKTTFYKIYI